MLKVKMINTDEFVLFDNKDTSVVEGIRWHHLKSKKTNTSYARCTKTKKLAHEIILGKKPGLVIDHINRNGLDNRRTNLRHVTQSQNKLNSKQYKNNKSGFRGVWFDKNHNKWRASITVDGKAIKLGSFVDSERGKEQAAKAYDKAAKKKFGKFAQLNFS